MTKCILYTQETLGIILPYQHSVSQSVGKFAGHDVKYSGSAMDWGDGLYLQLFSKLCMTLNKYLQLQKMYRFVIVHRAEMPLTYSSASLCQR